MRHAPLLLLVAMLAGCALEPPDVAPTPGTPTVAPPPPVPSPSPSPTPIVSGSRAIQAPAEPGGCDAIPAPDIRRTRTSAAAGEDAVYVFGGRLADGRITDEILRVDLATGDVEVAGRMSAARMGVAVARVDDAYLLFGGFTFIRAEGGGDTTSLVEIWRPGDAVARVLPLRLDPERGHAAAAFDGEAVWLFGGDTGRENLAIIERYDPDSGTIRRMVDRLPTPRALVAAAYTAEGFFLAGGHGNDALHRRDVLLYTGSGAPETIAALRAPVAGASGVVVAGTALVVGGDIISDGPVSDVLPIDATGAGERFAMPERRTLHATVEIPNGFLVVGGEDQDGIAATMMACRPLV